MSFWGPIAAAALWGLVVAGVGGKLTVLDDWYEQLRRPRLQPPDWLFGPAWTLIFIMAGSAAVLAWWAAPDDAARGWIVALFLLNGVLNVLWNVLFFRWKRPDWALVEVVALWLSILAPLLYVAPLSEKAAWLLAPYLVWVGFASYLNLEIVRLNRPFGGAATAP